MTEILIYHGEWTYWRGEQREKRKGENKKKLKTV
jgi:hypothetical protein